MYFRYVRHHKQEGNRGDNDRRTWYEHNNINRNSRDVRDYYHVLFIIWAVISFYAVLFYWLGSGVFWVMLAGALIISPVTLARPRFRYSQCSISRPCLMS